VIGQVFGGAMGTLLALSPLLYLVARRNDKRWPSWGRTSDWIGAKEITLSLGRFLLGRPDHNRNRGYNSPARSISSGHLFFTLPTSAPTSHAPKLAKHLARWQAEE
jgi:hypothetical protein